ncbi:hypothetical protein LK994_10370 [Ferruginibacter lapsinanis]|uniref:hypothetical protein n=1 Tax=Ferruginibacter lapsinanis TaxID=563172 RepID=UPI001E30287E|nr:hypothetical protein [Ferruginibacter lapsinanis]UEG49035.1 hypothetical protein LK994_10370 [Ferruginibacter lapsinanis]
MAIRNFWRLFLKMLGIWIVISSISIALNYISTIASYYNSITNGEILPVLFLLIFSAGILFLIIRYFLFRTEWIIDRFKLDKGFNDEKIDIAISNQTFMAIVISVIGGISFIEAIPSLCKALFNFYQQDYVFRQSPGTASIIFYLVQAVIGLILFSNGVFFSKLLIRKTEEETPE